MAKKQFSLCMNCDLDLDDITLIESKETLVLNIIQIKYDSKDLLV